VVPSLENPKQAARISNDLMARVNYEIYFLEDRKALERFRKDPLRASGPLTDPVTRKRFFPGKKSPRLDHKGRPYFFSSDSTLALFQAAPDSFAVRKGF
jgi:YHS domain-containing protein